MRARKDWPVSDPVRKFGNSIYDKLFQPKFHLLAFLSEPSKLQALRNEVASQYAELMDFNAFAIPPEVAEVFGTDKDFSVLLRPDNHVGLISANISPSTWRNIEPSSSDIIDDNLPARVSRVKGEIVGA
jgi:hypothetical protein